MNTLERQRGALIAQLAELHEQGWEHQSEIQSERRLGFTDRPTKADKRIQLERDAEICSLERKLHRIEMYQAQCEPGCGCRGRR